MVKLYPCNCKVWKEGIDQLDAVQTLAWAHGINYTGKPFSFCPWCGKKRKEFTKAKYLELTTTINKEY